MTPGNVLQLRLCNQQIVQSKFKTPQELVSWMGAVQAQDYAMAKWAIGLRLQGWNDAGIEKAFNDGKILRTHVLRPTWHFVTSEDIRWMIDLTAPRILSSLAHNYRSFGWDKNFFKRSNDVLVKALQGGKQLTRDELKEVFKKAKIATDGLRFIHLLAHSELNGIICSGAKKGNQVTYALFNERVPNSKKMIREESLVELLKRYFTSHGPATVYDFAWWSGLSLTDARKGIEIVKNNFKKEVIDGKEYFFGPSNFKDAITKAIHLLPNYDEYTVAYKDRSFLFDKKHPPNLANRSTAIFSNAILINGKIEGIWKRSIKNNSVIVETKSFLPFSKTKQQAVKKATKKYREFVIA